MTGTVEVTHELGAFLRTRRERLDPHELGMPQRRRSRRTPGLRREEVAELAGVSIDYVVRLEQGRGLRPSPEVLEALAGALRLNPDERMYLFDLARQRLPDDGKPATEASPELVRLVRDLAPLPAMVLNHRHDILAWNPQMSRLLLDFDTLPSAQRNALWLCLLHPDMITFYGDRETIVRQGIAGLRSAWAAHPDDGVLAALIDEFRTTSAEFAALWEQRDVRVQGRGYKTMHHPDAGAVTVSYETLMPLQDPDQRLVIYRAADSQSQAALDRLSGS